MEVREVGEYAGGKFAGECDGREVKLNNVSVVLVAFYAGPVAGSGDGGVPE